MPYPPGGAVDQVTRQIAQKLTEQTGQTFFVENKAGATGTIGAQQVAKAAPDGYTLMANDTTYSILPHVFSKLPFDHERDLVPVAAFNFAPMALVVGAESRFKTLSDLVGFAKSNPGKLTYGTGGAGTTPHFSTEALASASGRPMSRTFRSRAQERPRWPCCGTIDFQIASTPGVMGQVKGGKVRLLGISGDKRLSALPNVPTFAEAGIKDYSVINFTGLWAPKGTPAPVMQRLQKEVAAAMASPDVPKFSADLVRCLRRATPSRRCCAKTRNWEHGRRRHQGRETIVRSTSTVTCSCTRPKSAI